MTQRAPTVPENAVAIIGMAGRFPGAENVSQFWRNVRNGVTSITHFSRSELEDAFPDAIRNDAHFVRARALLKDVDQFDAKFFGMRPREAALTDPQHRLMLECAWSALEDGGYDPLCSQGAIGVFAGCSMNTYLLTNVFTERSVSDRFASDYQVGSYDMLLGALSDTLATRISYKLNLRGPSMTVQSACSTSLLAVAQACQSLLLYQSDMAIAGGVSITFPQKRGYLHQEGGMVSPDGNCRPFDADAAGTVFGDGAAVVLLKRLEEALEDRDNIYAIIRGSAVNNDGNDKVGFTAPSVRGQADVIRSALAVSGVDASSIGYVECHGTATPLGDPIEFAGLINAFGRDGEIGQPYCALGSAKANVGHLDVASGATGLIKTALALHHREIPPLANFVRPNPHVQLAGSPFYVPTKAISWQESQSPRRAGVSSFGVGGTNVHLVLEEAPQTASARQQGGRTYVLPLSAKDDAALSSAALALADHIGENSDVALEDVAFTLQVGRRAFERRTSIVCASREDALDALQTFKPPATKGDERPPLVFMFPGQGEQYPGMGRRLYEDHHVFRTVINDGIDIVAPLIGVDLRDLLLASTAANDDNALNPTLLAQPALFLFEYALARLWISWGIKPDAMVGHSLGEFVAATLAGVFTFEDGCRLVATRARLMQDTGPGAMLAVRLSESELKQELGDALDLAAVNAPSLCVVSGSHQPIDAMKAALTSKGIACRPLATSHAFHSRSLDPILAEVERAVRATRLSAPNIPFVSCVTGDWISTSQACDPTYWARHCRAPVRFADAISTAVGNTPPFLLEVGPGKTLSALAAQTIDRKKLRAVATSVPAPDKGELAGALASLWNAGFTPDWRATSDAPGRRTPLPTYAFQRTRCWIDPIKPTDSIPEPKTPSAAATVQTSVVGTTDTPMSTLSVHARSASRIGALQTQIVHLLEDLSGTALADVDTNTTFLELGFDSLFLGQVARALEIQFKIKITFRQLFNDVPSVADLAKHLDAQLPREQTPETVTSPPASLALSPSPMATSATGSAPDDAYATVVHNQLQTMQALFVEQLRVFQTRPPAASAAPTTNPPQITEVETPLSSAPVRHGSSASANSNGLTDTQRRFITELARRVNERTPRSKAQTKQDRATLADPRTVAGFHTDWKELIYPVIADRAKGSKIWDIDGNEYIDLVNGFGQTAFGHSPDFVIEAVSSQLQKGFPIGPQSPVAGQVAELIAEMTGCDRVTFCNTGSEAVMAAMRIARAVTGRDRVVIFAHDYHGQFDEVLVKPASNTAPPRTLPIAPGIPAGNLTNVTVLTYGEKQSLDWIETHGDEIAAVIVEPVQSRHPLLRPKAFLDTLRAITKAHDVALVFDEVVTGFRVHPGGMQAVFDIKADLATYGKVVGGGMPIGVLAGTSRFMDALDGGAWNYGDDSVPEVAPTFFAGTFVRHPLVLAAAKAVLLYLKAEGPSLQEKLAARMGGLVDNINADLARRGLKTRAEGYSSWFYVNFSAEDRLGTLFYPYARLLGVHIQEGYPCFLTTAHSDADIKAIEIAFSAALDALADGGILTGAKASAPNRAQAAPTLVSAPLTEPQLEILMAAQASDEASCAYNESISLTLRGDLDAATLNRAFADVIARHDALRAHVERGETRLIFAPQLSVRVEDVDYSAEPDPRAALGERLKLDATTPFDLYHGPLLRAFLVKLSTDEHVFVFSAHHIVCDGWSTNVVLEELAQFYVAHREGRGVELGPVESMRHYAEREAERASSKGKADAERFWAESFRTLPPPLELPLDRSRPVHKSWAGASHTDTIEAALVRDLRKAGARVGCTLFLTIYGALQAMLARFTGQNDFVIGCPSAGQADIPDKALVGHCVNLLPLRSQIDPRATFAQHLSFIRGPLLEAFDHSDFTFGELLRKLNVPRDPNRTPLASVLFNLEKLGDRLDFPGLTAHVTPNPKAAVNFDISFNMIESNDGIRIDVDYSTDVLDAATVARWVENLRVVLRAVADNCDQPIATLPLLGVEERAWLLARNVAHEPLPADINVATIVARMATQRGDETALLCGEETLSYGALETRANQLARVLAKHGITKGDRVALLATRSFDAITSILAILKCGAAYVPLDPAYPTHQLDFMLSDSRPKVAIVQRALLEREETITFDPAERIVLEEALSASKTESEVAFTSPARGDDGAAIMYTSGSTGRPKGVIVPHRGIARLVSNQTFIRFGRSETSLHLASLAFDPSTLEIWSALLHGGKLAIVSMHRPSATDIERTIKRHNVTFAQFTTALFHALVDENVEALAPLKQIVIGGEVLSPMHVRKVQDAYPECLIVNAYGPTENSVITTAYRVRREDRALSTLPIGAPIARTSCYVFDQHGALAAKGATGELYVGGDGVARGYFERPDLTAERFVPDPFEARGYLYRTGDLARWRGDGVLEFIGRADGQIKINGFRVEVGEIEAAIMENKHVGQAVVIAHKVRDGVKTLRAYVTQERDSTLAPDALVAALGADLARRLPLHMQPRGLMTLAAMPITPNGKIDRSALPPFVAHLPEATGADTAADEPASEIERKIAAVWSQVLGCERVTREQPIFSLGADSLHIFRMAARYADQGISIDARQLMQNPTVAELARFLEEQSRPQRAPALAGPSLDEFRHGARRRKVTP